MTNTYIIRNKSLNKLLDNTSNFEDKMVSFIERHPQYKYEVKIDRDEDNDEWILELNLSNKDESTNTKTSKSFI